MKKSVLIAGIKADLDNKYSEQTILEILHLAEAYGMAPPTIEEESWKIKENGEMTYEERYWEPE